MIGKSVGAIRRVGIWVPAGNCETICAMAALTCRVALAMSRPQLKLIEMSAAPRLVVERTSTTPSNRRPALSTPRGGGGGPGEDAGPPPHGVLNRPGDLHLHLLGRAVAGVERNHDSRKIDR